VARERGRKWRRVVVQEQVWERRLAKRRVNKGGKISLVVIEDWQWALGDSKEEC
jgi:hypothetical protein